MNGSRASSRKAFMDCKLAPVADVSRNSALHLEVAKAEIAKHLQSVKTVIANLEQDLDLQTHPDTLKHF